MFATIVKNLRRDRRGATAVEYGFILALIVVVVFTAIAGLARVTTTMWNDVASKVEGATSGR
ncbi:pilus assembly protein [Sphingomonas panacis]|uniref:Pilus assembly protein n=1 Tax=Sphingomonas panacis TaxID=1560345 RepID=A0A1B3ZBN4_9SPHN|nr:Flp family type IVb pilin [Sphingomonas panacis]AOH84836.1 pilus assembly protein [Sphingomonas panacis]